MSVQTIKVYADLIELRDRLNNEILPLAVHSGLNQEDYKLYRAMEKLAAQIERHLSEYRIEIIHK